MRGNASQAFGALLAAAMFSPAAASDFPTEYRAALEAGHIEMAADVARAEIDGGQTQATPGSRSGRPSSSVRWKGF